MSSPNSELHPYPGQGVGLSRDGCSYFADHGCHSLTSQPNRDHADCTNSAVRLGVDRPFHNAVINFCPWHHSYFNERVAFAIYDASLRTQRSGRRCF